MAATEQEMMERAARIQTIEELREVSAELGLVAAGCEGVELPIVLPGFDGLTETGGSR